MGNVLSPAHAWNDGSGNAAPSKKQPGPGGGQLYNHGTARWSESETGGGDFCDFTSNAGDYAWLGFNPYDATTITPSLQWSVSGYGISLSLPAGAAFSKTSSAISYFPGSVSNSFQASIRYPSKVTVHAALITHDYFAVNATYQFGSSFYYVSASA